MENLHTNERKLDITVCICTLNSAEFLNLTLESVSKLETSGIEFEILVIDNGSTDNTSQVVKDWVAIFRNKLRYIFLPEPGLSRARNVGLYESHARVVSFIDDDALVERNWMQAIYNCFENYKPSIVGGRAFLKFLDGRPDWLPESAELFLSCLDYGDERLVDTDREMFGVNFSVDAEIGIQLGGFREDLGRIGTNLISGEENDFLLRAKLAGGTVVYEPDAVVRHVVKPERLNRGWFIRRVYANGRTSTRRAAFRNEVKPFFYYFFWMLRRMGGLLKSLILHPFDGKQRFRAILSFSNSIGMFSERCRIKKDV